MKPHEPGSQAPGPPPVGGLAGLLASLQGFYRRHREHIWSAFWLFVVYFFFLPFYTFVFEYAAPSSFMTPTPWSSPLLPYPVATLLGHLRFAFFYTLPLTLFALLLVLHTRFTSAHHPTVRPLVWAALLALILYYLPGLPRFGYYASGKQKALTLTVTKLFPPFLGGCLTTTDLMATLYIPPGALAPPKPAVIDLRSIPYTLPAPGPVPEQATLIAAVETWRSNPYDEENDYFANFFRPPAPLRLSLKHAVAPAKNSTHYTEVCSWYGEEGDDWGNKNYWHCQLSDIGPGTDKKGQGYIEVELGGLDSRPRNFYVFQFPKEWANQNCVEAGGRINPNIPIIDFHSFKGACRGRSEGRVAQIGQLLAPERPSFTPPPKEPPATP